MSSDPEHEDLRAKLSPIQYAVTQEASTEAPFTGAYWDHHDEGTYRCIVCGESLFDSGTKFEVRDRLELLRRRRAGARHEQGGSLLGMRRTEVTCSHCGAHLGHSGLKRAHPAATGRFSRPHSHGSNQRHYGSFPNE